MRVINKLTQCAGCPKSFVLDQPRRIYCSRRCRGAAATRRYRRRISPLTERMCEASDCDTVFTPEKRADQRFCHKRCAQREHYRRRSTTPWRTKVLGRECRWCRRADGEIQFASTMVCDSCQHQLDRTSPCGICGAPFYLRKGGCSYLAEHGEHA